MSRMPDYPQPSTTAVQARLPVVLSQRLEAEIKWSGTNASLVVRAALERYLPALEESR